MDRTLFIGSSDAPGIAGISPFEGCTPLDVYLEKIGLGRPRVESEPMRWGTVLEPLVLAEYERQTGIILHERQKRVTHPVLPFISAQLDGYARYGVDDPSPIVVEAKTAGFSDGWTSDDDGIPPHYHVQVQHQLACVPAAKFAHVPVLFHGNRLRIYTIPRDDAAIDRLMEIERRFWACVQRREPPTWGPMPADALARVNPECRGEITLDSTIGLDVDGFAQITETIKGLEKTRDRLKSQILAAMGTAEIGVLTDGRRIKRYLREEAAKKYTVDRKASTIHYFKILGGEKV